MCFISMRFCFLTYLTSLAKGEIASGLEQEQGKKW